MNEAIKSYAMRKLPTDILRPQPQFNLEAQQVAEKYSNISRQIGEGNIDHVALDYMNDEARAFWLPRFLEYVMTDAPSDSYHLEYLLFKLEDVEFSHPLLLALDPSEKHLVRHYLIWLQTESGFLDGSNSRRDSWLSATKLWSDNARNDGERS